MLFCIDSSAWGGGGSDCSIKSVLEGENDVISKDCIVLTAGLALVDQFSSLKKAIERLRHFVSRLSIIALTCSPRRTGTNNNAFPTHTREIQ